MKWTYHESHKYKDSKTNKEFQMITQLYKVGVYTIVNGDPAWQTSMTPNQIVKIEKHLKKMEEKGDIKDLEFGISITVSDDSGFYEEVIT